MEYVTKKLYKKDVGSLKKLQAKLELQTHERQPEAKVIGKALEFAQGNEKAFVSGFEKKYTLLDLVGFAKGGPKTNVADELDDVVYGNVDKT